MESNLSKTDLLKWAGEFLGIDNLTLKRLETGALFLLILAKAGPDVF